MSGRDQQQTITRDQRQTYARLFINRWDAYLGLALAGHWTCRKEPLTGRYLAAAWGGEVALGLYSVDPAGLSRWACIDVDDDRQRGALTTIIAQLPDPQMALLEPWEPVRAWPLHLAHAVGLAGVESFRRVGD